MSVYSIFCISVRFFVSFASAASSALRLSNLLRFTALASHQRLFWFLTAVSFAFMLFI
jgi:hypothetical protein